MGLIEQVFSLVFGSGRNVLRETAEVFRPNAEAQSRREYQLHGAALNQFAQEFYAPQRSWFDQFMDGLNRVPRPALALGTLGLFVAAMIDPVWFAERMAGIALVPEPLWWLLGAIVSFYFGARHQAKGQDFQRDLAHRMAQYLPDEMRQIDGAAPDVPPVHAVKADGNAALQEWLRLRGQAGR
jgi:hypothetical protein